MFRWIIVLSVVLAALTSAAFSLDAVQERSANLVPPQILLRDAAPVTHGETESYSLEFVLLNPNTQPIKYVGYTSDSFDPPLKDDRISPIHKIELKRDGQWKAFPLGWCGTGMGRVPLESKRAATFEVWVPGSDWDAVRVGVSLVENAKTSRVVWSRAVTRDDLGKRPPQETKVNDAKGAGSAAGDR